MFLLPHILFIVGSLVITIALMVGLAFVKNQKAKDAILKIFAVMTFVIHISIMWVDFLKNGKAEAYDNILFPIYFCNLTMYLLLICAFIKNKKSYAWQIFATFIAYAGVFGTLITLFTTPLEIPANYERVKSLVSHVTMMWGCLYLFVGKYIKINVFNLVPYCIGLLSCGVVGSIVNGIFLWAGLGERNAMYLQHPPAEAPMFTCWSISGLMILLIFVFTAIYEMFAYKKEYRFYRSLEGFWNYFPRPKKKDKAEVATSESSYNK